MTRLGRVFLTTVLLAPTCQVLADDCDGLLAPDITEIKKDVATALSYLSIINKENFDQQKKAFGAGATIPIAEALVKASANYDDFKVRRDKLYSEYKFDYDFKDLSQYYIRALPPSRSKDYLNCRQLQSGFQVEIVTTTADKVALRVTWKAPSHREMRVPFTLRKAVFGGSLLSEMPRELLHNAPRNLFFKRAPNEDFFFAPNVGASSQPVFIPKYIPPQPKPIVIPAANFIGSRSMNVAAGAGACRNGHYGPDVLLNAFNCNEPRPVPNAAEYEFTAEDGCYQLKAEYASDPSDPRPVKIIINGKLVMTSH